MKKEKAKQTSTGELSEILEKEVVRFNYIDKDTIRAIHDDDRYLSLYAIIKIDDIVKYRSKSTLGKLIFRKILKFKGRY